ncbi:MAG: chromosomal replication initiator protein DnaA [Ktedonobacterales bacterium]
MSNAHVWLAAQERLRQQMTPTQFDTWLRGTWLAEERDGVTVLCVRTTFAKEHLETRFRERIETAIASVTGRNCTLLLEVVAGEPESGSDSASLESRRDRASVSQLRGRSRISQSGGPTLFDNPDEVQPRPVAAGAVTRQYIASVDPNSRNGGHRGASEGGSPSTGSMTPSFSQPGADDDELDDGDIVPEASAYAEVVEPARTAEQGVTSAGYRRSNGGSPSTSVGQAHTYASQIEIPRLNQRYTFSTFIVGSGNQLAHAASQAVADTPGKAYNPLFLYGGVGLGKTHLLHAIGHTALARHLVVLYVSSETFTNEIVNAIRYRTTEEFRAKYRSVDVLLVDDIQFIAGKDSTEEEFFHTFNSLYEASKQIVMCSDRPPKAIVSLEERLRSRFEWGLIADIQPPDLETRVAILRAKSDAVGRRVPDEVIDYLASRVQSNIRDLEGSFNRLLAMNQLQGLPLTLETAKVALNNLASDGQQKRVSLDEILETVAEYYRIPREDLCGKQRDKHIVVPRQVAMFLMRQETQASLLDIGNALGGRDHSTILHGCEKIAREVNDNTALRKEVMAIRQQLLG